VRQVRDLTGTPLGDEAGLTVRGGYAAFATVAFGGVQAVTVLDLGGERAPIEPLGLLGRAQRWLTAWQRSGAFGGLDRLDILFDHAPAAVELDLAPPQLEIAVDGRGQPLRVDLAAAALTDGRGAPPSGVRVAHLEPTPKPPLIWAVDTVRAAVGPRPVAWAEDVGFGAVDLWRRAYYGFVGEAGEFRAGTARPAPPRGEDATALSDAAAEAWPPPNLPTMWQPALPGEGVWEPVAYPFLARVGGARDGVPPYFYRTFLRPDPERPYSRLLLIALDMRQLELRVQAGYEDPRPLTGPSGTGRLPRDEGTLDRVVATFNGAFKTDHGAYGMVVDGRVLLPPVQDAATFLVDDRGRAAFGTWPRSSQVPAEVRSLRQNLEPLLVDGVVNPSRRATWGEQLVGSTAQTQRTALCLTPNGQVYYAFGSPIDAESLGRGLRQAGCSYAIHLDMNPGHCGFVFLDVINMDEHRVELRKADPEMKIAPEKFAFASAKDFFYVLVRDLVPAPIEGAAWKPSPGTQPTPEALPGIFTTRIRVGGVEVELTSLEQDRVVFALRAGEREPRPLTAPPPLIELDAADQARALAAIGVGATTAELQLGLSFVYAPTLPFRDDAAALVVDREGSLTLHEGTEALHLAPGEAAAQVPLLLSGAKVAPRAREAGPLRDRAALGITPEGRVVVARAVHDTSAVLASALLLAGCQRAVELERGAQLPPVLDRAGTPTAPARRYDGTVLFALDRPMRPRAYRWGAAPP
jgi:hypothetical protein